MDDMAEEQAVMKIGERGTAYPDPSCRSLTICCLGDNGDRSDEDDRPVDQSQCEAVKDDWDGGWADWRMAW